MMLDIHPQSRYNESMKDIELKGDLLDEYLAHQEAETSNEPEMASDEEIKELLVEMWEEMLAPEPEEEYTEEDAFREFYADQYEEYN
jgi:hypothetical protein